MLRFRLQGLLALFLALVFSAASAAPDGLTYFHIDNIGSPIAATDTYGNVTWRENYLPYGEKRAVELSSGSNQQWFTGHLHDEDTKLTYMGARYYDPVLGRFLSVDPVGFDSGDPFSFNRYAYANNNPFNNFDPDGREAASAAWLQRTDAFFAAMPPPRNTTEAALVAAGFALPVVALGGVFATEALVAVLANPATATEIAASLLAQEALGPGTLIIGGGVLKAAEGLTDAASAAAKAGAATTRATAGTLKGLGNIGSHGVVDAGTALGAGEKWLGAGYKEIAPGVFRSADGLRQFRMTDADILGRHGNIGSHVHFEALNDAGKVIENLHLPVTP